MPDAARQRPEHLSRFVRQEASRLGFDACGISRAVRLDEEAVRLEAWLGQSRHASMSWMEGHFEKRVDPRRLVEGARSVVSVLQNYAVPARLPDDPAVGRISRYAWGDDYHDVMKRSLFELFESIRSEVGDVSGRAFVDSAPVMDKVWAERSGLGWIGKNANLISRDHGSWFFIGELILDLDLHPDGPTTDHCGTCTRCIDACPTDAIYQPYVVDANRCISYLTIEHRTDDVEPELREKMGNWIFGCDVCQEVCPWNKFSTRARRPEYRPREGSVDTELETWMELDLDDFRRRFSKSPVKRTRYEGFRRNVRYALENARRGDGPGI